MDGIFNPGEPHKYTSRTSTEKEGLLFISPCLYRITQEAVETFQVCLFRILITTGFEWDIKFQG